MDKYNEYLAVNVLNEQQLVSYRSLSRALKVHGNLAKQMLFEFHRKQNTKKPGSVHATYLISGAKKSQASTNGVTDHDEEDVNMQSSPMLPGSSMPNQEKEEEEHQPVEIRSVTLVREEHLARARAEFDLISSIHIYSLEAEGLSDFQTLSECNRQIAVKHAEEDPLSAWRQYGTIQNQLVQRRDRQNGAQPRAFLTSDTKSKVHAAQPKAVEPVAVKPKQVSTTTTTESTSEPVKKEVPSLKRESSSLFKAFAKTKPAPQKSESQNSAPEPEPTKDEAMVDFSDEEDNGDDDAGIAPLGEDGVEPAGQSKQEREAQLRAMMEQEDEVMEDVDGTPKDVLEDDEETIDTAQPVPDEPKETVTVEGGRRRGRRRVMKKKTVKDEDGYLVTREEAAWESFSEEEPATKKAKVLPAASTKPTGAKKANGRPGQGNIMSFFSKK